MSRPKIKITLIDRLRYGGHLPGQEDGTAVFCCPDVDTINVFRIEIVE